VIEAFPFLQKSQASFRAPEFRALRSDDVSANARRRSAFCIGVHWFSGAFAFDLSQLWVPHLWLANCQSKFMKRTRTHARNTGSDDFNFYIHDGATSFRLEIEGSLSGEASKTVEQAWCTASSTIGKRTLVIGVGNVRSIDPFGRALLQRLHEEGAQFVGRSPLAKTLVGAIVGQPVTSAMRVTTCGAWDRFRAYALPMIPLITLFFPVTVNAASLEPSTSKAWEEYVESASKGMEQRLRAGKTFLWVDEVPDRLARIRAGEVVVSPVGAQNPKRVPSGLIHDWVGAAFIPHVTLKDVLEVVSDYARYKDFYHPTVTDSKVIATNEAKDRFSMLLVNRSLLLKTAFDTDYESCYVHVDDRHGYSVSRTTRIQEIEEYGAASQHTLHEGEGSGVIWRLFGIARYIERDGGVYIELEAIGLSRDIPGSLRWLVEPMIRHVSRGSLSTSLRQTENAVRLRVELAKVKSDGTRSTAAAGRESSATHELQASRSTR
jgi:hypothetical protein